MVDLYGGEVGLLPYEYVTAIKELFHTYGIDDINLITNLSMVNDTIKDEDFFISVSYDFEAREKHEQVWRNMLLLKRPFSVLMLASPKLIQKDVDYYDADLARYITADAQKANKVINAFLSKNKETTGDAFMLWRLKELAQQPHFEVQGELKGLKDFDIKKRTAVEAAE
jgi:hypothetical protein